MARPYANDLRRKFLHLKLFRQLPQGPFALLIGNRKLFGARSLVLGSLPLTIAEIPPERRPNRTLLRNERAYRHEILGWSSIRESRHNCLWATAWSPVKQV